MKSAFVKYKLSYSDLTINPHDTAPLLGYTRTLPDDILATVKEIMDETAECFNICGGYRIFDNITFVADKNQITVSNVDFFPQGIVYQQLKHSRQIAVFVCTAGNEISQWAKQMMANNEPLKGFIADAIGSVVVETAIEAIQNRLSNNMAQAGFHTTNRYSPGYCGWHTKEQHKLFSILNEETCGISLTESALMLPVKSVSGFIGIGEKVNSNTYTCNLCDAAFCAHPNRKV